MTIKLKALSGYHFARRAVFSAVTTPLLKYYIAQMLAAATALLALPVLTRVYPPESYGTYLLVVSGVTLIASLHMNWIVQSTLRFVPGSDATDNVRGQLTSLSLLLALSCGLISSVIVPLIASLSVSFLDRGLIGVYAILLAMGLASASRVLAQEQGARYSGYLICVGVIPPVLGIILGLWWVPNLTALLVSQITALLIALATTISFRAGFSLRIYTGSARQFAVFGLPLTLWVVSTQLLNSLDRFMLSRMQGPVVVGIYATNYNLVIAVQSFAFGPLLLAAHPRLMSFWNSRNPIYEAELRQTISVYSIIAGLTLGIFLSGYESLGRLLMAPEYQPGNYLMPVIAFGHILFGYASYINKSYEFMGQTWKMGILALIAVCVNYALNLVLMPTYGMAAAAYTTVASYAIYLAISYAARPKQVPLSLTITGVIPIVVFPLVMFSLRWFLETFAKVGDVVWLLAVTFLALLLGSLSLFHLWIKRELPSSLYPRTDTLQMDT